MHMHPRLLTREEVEPETGLAKNGWAHGARVYPKQASVLSPFHQHSKFDYLVISHFPTTTAPGRGSAVASGTRSTLTPAPSRLAPPMARAVIGCPAHTSLRTTRSPLPVTSCGMTMKTSTEERRVGQECDST